MKASARNSKPEPLGQLEILADRKIVVPDAGGAERSLLVMLAGYGPKSEMPRVGFSGPILAGTGTVRAVNKFGEPGTGTGVPVLYWVMAVAGVKQARNTVEIDQIAIVVNRERNSGVCCEYTGDRPATQRLSLPAGTTFEPGVSPDRR